MAENTNNKKEIKENMENTYSLTSVGFAYFLKKYWEKRNNIFNELYRILYAEEPPAIENVIIKNQKNDSGDDLSDLKYYENHPEYFKYFEDDTFRKFVDLNVNNKLINKAQDDENENIDENINKDFITKTRNLIYRNYLENYIKKKYKFKNENFSLSADFDKKIFFMINNIKIFEIKYLIIIKINNNINEWVCNSKYGLYLLHKIKRIKKPYPIYAVKSDDIEIKTISNIDDFDDLISKGINEFEDLNYQIDLNEIIMDNRQYFNFQLLKSIDKYKKFMNLSEETPIFKNFDFINKLFQKKKYF